MHKQKLSKFLVAGLCLVFLCSSTLAFAGSNERRRGNYTTGLLSTGFLFSQSQVKFKNPKTIAINFGAPILMPKLLKSFGFNRTISNIGGAFLSGAAIAKYNFNYNTKGVLNQGLTWAATAGIQDYGYKHHWDTKVFSGATHLASTIAGNTLLNGLGKPKAWKAPELGDYLAEAARLYAIERLSQGKFKDYTPVIGSLVSGVFGKNTGTSFKSVLGAAGSSVLLSQVTNLGLDPYTAANLNLYLTASLLGGKQALTSSMQQAVDSFATGGLGKRPPDAGFAAQMLDFYRDTQGLPSSSWTKADYQRFQQTGKGPDLGGIWGALSSRFYSNIHAQSAANLNNWLRGRNVWGKRREKAPSAKITMTEGTEFGRGRGFRGALGNFDTERAVNAQSEILPLQLEKQDKWYRNARQAGWLDAYNHTVVVFEDNPKAVLSYPGTHSRKETAYRFNLLVVKLEDSQDSNGASVKIPSSVREYSVPVHERGLALDSAIARFPYQGYLEGDTQLLEYQGYQGYTLPMLRYKGQLSWSKDFFQRLYNYRLNNHK